ncbi:HNH endonuclease [Shewanella maritima]|uniref:HNH endonuclease n=1 Tax=Shewanella maritima TaxID=2520507 RepID=UPI0037361DE1
MMRLKAPKHSFLNSIDKCCDGITGNNVLKNKVIQSKNALEAFEQVYSASGQTGELFTFAPLKCGKNDDPVVLGNLTKSELVKLYDSYFVGSKKPGRSIYNSLMLAADEKCPFCGGIGRPRNLDHYLPKAHFPFFSVLPINLVPSCRDCNMDGKGQGFAISKGMQVIQPYLDDLKFFNEQWIYASYTPGVNDEPGTFVYSVNPPENWDIEEKKRVHTHFKDFDLAVRYATKAAEELITCLTQINSLKSLNIPDNQIKQALIEPVIAQAPFVNHWRRGMYQAIGQILLNGD